MDRRQFITVAGAGAASSIAGCTSQNSAAPANLEWTYEYQGYVGRGMQPAMIVTGSVENIGDGAADRFYLQARVLTPNGGVIAKQRKRYDSIDSGEEQEFWYKFELTQDEMEEAEEIKVRGRFPEETFTETK